MYSDRCCLSISPKSKHISVILILYDKKVFRRTRECFCIFFRKKLNLSFFVMYKNFFFSLQQSKEKPRGSTLEAAVKQHTHNVVYTDVLHTVTAG